MEARGFYHEGMLALQERADGRRLADFLATSARHSEFSERDAAQITAASFFFIASSHGDHPDCSFKGGDPGFVKIVGPSTLEFPDYDGNLMYRTLGNIAMNPKVGLLFMGFDGKTYRIRINGDASIHRDAESLTRHHGAKAVIRVECRDIYPNCPRYVPDLAMTARSAYVPRPGETSPTPEWKTLPAVVPHLPRSDTQALTSSSPDTIGQRDA
ncbi:pyridoxamine 5'-phosphate oxidase family protein [Bradyrhizobium tropiciagri]|uniref:pyridoxamine 5'-phosphate oxidase family protein n=1 Tax=Bradyrhizobium tropiciagri TaxID=312253 RepID=UPI001BA9824B|nr:pyridoxamine 5'-phosphate oxidase family protein [Bradyrhizobium tropiciagri]MBR0896052.1 pyridoxamine 5'-phosphate oxidase family protein [Bradyrhizobium tropiciagri]